MIIEPKNNKEERLKDEFDFLSKKYEDIAFNYIDWNGNVRGNKKYLFATEGYITIPNNYSAEIISKYKGILTPSQAFYVENKSRFNIIVTNGPLNLHNYYKLDNFVDYDQKIDGVVSLNRIYHTGNEGDILYLRELLFNQLDCNIKNTFGPNPWGGDCYKGKIQSNHPNCIENLEVINRYKFVLTLEPMYHKIWSFDWVTERMWNAFKSKTIPIYYGCYNIENKVPKKFFIDLRDYNLNINEAYKYAKSLSKQQYEDMVESAYEWYNCCCRISNLDDLEDILGSLK